MRRTEIILIKVGGGDPKKMDLTATIRTLIQVILRLTLIRIYDRLMIIACKRKTF